MPNWTMLRAVADQIEEKGETHFDMSIFLTRYPQCGTVACVAGHTVWLIDGATDNDERSTTVLSKHPVFIRAKHLLELGEDEAEELFLVENSAMRLCDVDINVDLVPAALRWMVDNKIISWDAAAEAVGFAEYPGKDFTF